VPGRRDADGRVQPPERQNLPLCRLRQDITQLGEEHQTRRPSQSIGRRQLIAKLGLSSNCAASVATEVI